MLPESKSPLALAREAVELAKKATPGPWTKKPPEYDTGTGFKPGVLVAATSPSKANRIYADPPGGSYPSSDQDLIAFSGTHLATVARAAIEMAALLEQTRRVHQHDAEEWCSVNDDYPEAFCTCGADAWNARIDALTKGEQ